MITKELQSVLYRIMQCKNTTDTPVEDTYTNKKFQSDSDVNIVFRQDDLYIIVARQNLIPLS